MSGRAVLSCPAALDWFAGHLDGELGTEDGRSLEQHLGACESCLEQTRGMAEVHRDLAIRSAREDARDPIPAVLARIRWDSASQRRPRPARPSAQDSRLFVAAIAALAAALLLAFLGFDRGSPPRRAVRPEPAPVAELPVPAAPVPSPAPRPAAPPREEIPHWTPPREPGAVALPDQRPVPPESAPPAIRRVTIPEAPLAIAEVVRTGQRLFAGETLAADEPAIVLYPDGTRLFLSADTAVTFGGRGKSIAIARGEVVADVAPQPRDEPMILGTAGAEVRVLGTVVGVSSRSDATLVAVEKGRVLVTRKSDRWSIPLREGQGLTVEPGRLPKARSLPDNLLADPGFEADGLAWGGFFNRSLGRSYGGVSVTPDVFRSGGRALQLITNPAAGRDREVFQDVAVAPGDAIECSGWLRTAGVTGKGIRLSILWLGAGTFVEGLTADVRSKDHVIREDFAGSLTGTSDWTRFGLRTVAPPQAKQVRLLVFADVDLGGPSTVWADDLILRRFQKGR